MIKNQHSYEEFQHIKCNIRHLILLCSSVLVMTKVKWIDGQSLEDMRGTQTIRRSKRRYMDFGHDAPMLQVTAYLHDAKRL